MAFWSHSGLLISFRPSEQCSILVKKLNYNLRDVMTVPVWPWRDQQGLWASQTLSIFFTGVLWNKSKIPHTPLSPARKMEGNECNKYAISISSVTCRQVNIGSEIFQVKLVIVSLPWTPVGHFAKIMEQIIFNILLLSKISVVILHAG